MGFRFRIAATRNDWLNLFRNAEGCDILRFYPPYAFSLEEFAPQPIQDIPALGIAKHGILVQEDAFLAAPVTELIKPRKIIQNDGVIRYCLDQITTLDSFIYRHGGLWNDRFYVVGEMSSLHNSGLCADAAKKIRNALRRTFHRRYYFWIGPECERLYDMATFTDDYRMEAEKTR